MINQEYLKPESAAMSLKELGYVKNVKEHTKQENA
jgi:hypothetical protein